ncbi:MAG: hypothetical protein ACSHXY_07330 [Alphaproteobacteria bacterium]
MAKFFGTIALSLLVFGACAPETLSDETLPAETAIIALDIPLESVLMDKSAGCLEGPNAEFGRYLGDWDMQSQTLSRKDGKTWTNNPPARWNFTCVGNGIAIQDFWMPSAGGFGTNLRMYNPESESWAVAWTSTGTPGMTEISAKKDVAGNIVMDYVKPVPTPLRRITFFTPDDTGWDWHLDMSMDDGKSWTTVNKMRASKH